MDLLKLIRENSEALKRTTLAEGLAAVILHLERAEKYLIQGRDEPDPFHFNDVLYRTNQAYEGILKEAYMLLASKDGTKLKTVKLEKYFATQSVLSVRVADAFQTYRRDWRNPSTHDHRLSVPEQDATLALSTISTFVYLLVDQMIQTTSSQTQKKRTNETRRPKRLSSKRSTSLGERVSEALMNHGHSVDLAALSRKRREVEIIGAIAGHLEASLPGLHIEKEPVLRGDSFALRPDLIVKNGETVVVEVERFSKAAVGERLFQAFAKLERYLQLLKAREGVVYLLPSKPDEKMIIAGVLREVDNREVMLHIVTPSSAISNFDEFTAWLDSPEN